MANPFTLDASQITGPNRTRVLDAYADEMKNAGLWVDNTRPSDGDIADRIKFIAWHNVKSLVSSYERNVAQAAISVDLINE